MKIALILFAYNRPKYLKKAIKTHVIPAGIDTYAFVDKSDKQGEVVDIIEKSGLYDVIVPRQEHYGLNKNIRDGIGRALLHHDAVIVLEDDLLLNDDAIIWLSEKLKYNPVVSLQQEDSRYPFRCWGWGMWRYVWDDMSWYSDDSWDVVVNENFKMYGYASFCSDKSRVKHIGAKGVHYNLIGYLKEKIF